MWIFSLLLIQLFYFEGFSCFCHEYYVGLIPTMNGRIQDYVPIMKSQVPSIERCTEICSRDTSCVTFFYNSKTGQCQTHSIVLQPNSADQIDSDWRYYQIYTGKYFIYKYTVVIANVIRFKRFEIIIILWYVNL